MALLIAGCSLDFDRLLATDGGPSDGGAEDGGAEDGGVLAAPILDWPWNGYDTGTARQPAPEVSARPRRPTFRWHAVNGATRYEIEIGESCEPWPEPSCAVGDILLRTTATENELTPAEDLPAAVGDRTEPLNRAASGTRYFWRVRACDDDGCSAYSSSRYLDVGRLPDDYDGDGYSDLLVGEPTSNAEGAPEPGPGAAYVFRGGERGLDEIASTRIEGDETFRLGVRVAAAGDVNGDGFADALVVSGHSESADQRSRAYLLLGSVDGLAADLDEATLLETPEPGAEELRAVGVGDVNGDGFDDVVIGEPSSAEEAGVAYVFYGSRAGLASEPSRALPAPMPQAGSRFGATVAGVGDFDGDGYSDVAIAAGNYNDDGSLSGRAHIFLGGPEGLDPSRRILLSSPSRQPTSFFGYALAGRGGGEIFASALLHDEDDQPNVGIVYRLRADATGLIEVVESIHCTDPLEPQMRCGSALSLGDIRGDGALSLAIGAQGQSTEWAEDTGVAHLFQIGSSLARTHRLEVNHDQATVRFAEQVHANADFDGDGRRDVVMSARRYSDASGDESGAAVVFLGRALSANRIEPILFRAPEPSSLAWFGASVAGF